jgi:bacteriocin biosynthesis cyclodehydratase domain-containing protein
VRALLSDTGLVADVGGSGFFDSDFVVAAPAADEMPELSVWNRQALAARVAWLPLSPFDGHGWTIGPFAIPHETCCFECYRTRRALTVEYADDAKLVDIAASRSRNVTPVDAIVAGIAAMFAWRWLALSDPYLPGMLYSLGWSEGLSLGKHEVLRVPRCSACAEPGIAAGLAPWREPAAT